MKTRVQKWGSSLALRIPKPFATEIGLRRNSPVEVSLVEGRLVIVPVIHPRSLDINAAHSQTDRPWSRFPIADNESVSVSPIHNF